MLLVCPAAADPNLPGEPGPTANGEQVWPHQLPPHPRDAGPQQERQIPRLYPVDQAEFGQIKARANAAAAAQPHLPGASPVQTAPTPEFPSLGYAESGGWNPSDAALATGPDSHLVVVNEALALYDKAGQRLLGPVSLQDFFGIQGSVFDPRALYDAGSGRFAFLAVTMNTRAKTSTYTLAVSQNSNPQNPTTGWCTYKLNAVTGSRGSAAWADFPGFGQDGDNLYITSNQFAFGSNRFQSARLLVIPKTSVYSAENGSCPQATSTDFPALKNPDGSAAFTVQPATQPDASPGQSAPMHFVNAPWASWSQSLVHRSLTKNGAAVQLSAPSSVTVSYFDMPADVPQPNGSPIDSGDTRLLGAVDRFGKIYTANNTSTVGGYVRGRTAPNEYANTQWYEFTPGDNESTGSANCGPATCNTYTITTADSSVAYFFPSVLAWCPAGGTCAAPSVGLQISGAGAGQPVSAFTYRKADVAPQVFASGVGGYQLNSRWGDYSAIASDPASAAVIWVLGGYAAASNAWGTAVQTITGS